MHKEIYTLLLSLASPLTTSVSTINFIRTLLQIVPRKKKKFPNYIGKLCCYLVIREMRFCPYRRKTARRKFHFHFSGILCLFRFPEIFFTSASSLRCFGSFPYTHFEVKLFSPSQEAIELKIKLFTPHCVPTVHLSVVG